MYDVIGIGFGPSNLALAIAIEQHNRSASAEASLDTVFLEKQPTFGWHRGMLIDDATMQVSFLKDLVTLRDPTSDFSFLSYLQCKGRLIEFINHKTLFPLRIEFHDYFEWAAKRVDHLVRYSSEVLAVEPVVANGEVRYFDVISGEGDDRGRIVVRRTRNVCAAVGLQPHLPPDAALSKRVWHNMELLPRVEQLRGAPLRRLLVVGAGQSAAEAAAYLHASFPEAEVCPVFSRYGYTPADDSPFANRIFDPEAVGVFFHAPDAVKRLLFDYHRNTNYSVVDMELIEALYRLEYQERVQGRRRLRILNASRVRQVDVGDAGVDVGVEFLPTGEVTTLTCDVLVYATGYRPCDVTGTLGEAAKLCLRNEEDQLRVNRDYRIVTEPAVTAGIYVQGATEHAHGITATLLSATAVRVGEIVDSILAHAGNRPADLPGCT